MAAITSSTIVSSPLATFKTVLSAASGLSSMNFVDNHFPSFTGRNFQEFPFAVISYPSVEENEKFFRTNIEFKNAILIRVHVEWDARSALGGFLDAIIAAIYANRTTFISSGIENITPFLTQPDDEPDIIKGKRVVIGEIAVEYETELAVE